MMDVNDLKSLAVEEVEVKDARIERLEFALAELKRHVEMADSFLEPEFLPVKLEECVIARRHLAGGLYAVRKILREDDGR